MTPEGHKNNTRRLDRIMAVAGLAIIGAAWLVGMSRAKIDLVPFLKQAVPLADHFEQVSGGTYTAWKDPGEKERLGHVTVGAGHGYGGNVRVAVAVSEQGQITGLALIDHKETEYFLGRVLKTDLLDVLRKKRFSDPFELGQDVDAVTGATSTTRALTEAVRKGSRKIAADNLGLPPIPEPEIPVSFGIPEAVLIGLIALAIIGHRSRSRQAKTVRWASWLVSLAVLGFFYSLPLTLAIVNKLLLGFWPEWQLNLYWYMLLAGALFFLFVFNRNTYCDRICPFGAAQECFGAIGWAKARKLKRLRTALLWAQRVLALGCVAIALAYYNPSSTSYEVFSAFFQLIGSNFTFGLLALVVVASFFIKRPWCNYLCPIRPVMDYLRLIRNWVGELWNRSKEAGSSSG